VYFTASADTCFLLKYIMIRFGFLYSVVNITEFDSFVSYQCSGVSEVAAAHTMQIPLLARAGSQQTCLDEIQGCSMSGKCAPA